ncbi:MAG: radical SAM/SPASM domain-containing protein, partial [Candidatus Bathyarchaeia archaeon]
VGLIITERCNAACSHCWFNSGPDRGREMSFEEAKGYIDQAREIPSIRHISFTGGEPFLLPEMLVRLVRYASDMGFYTECVTNSFWASTESSAEKMLRRLMDSGLEVINLSVDDFHQRQIPFERVLNSYRAARRLGLKVVLMCVTSRSSRIRIEEVKRMLRDEEIHIIGRGEPRRYPQVIAMEMGFVPAGRGAEIPEEEWLKGDGPLEGGCSWVLRDIAVAPGGRVLPCCSAAGAIENLSIGNAGVKRLGDILEDAWRMPLFKLLSVRGPLGLMDRVEHKPKAYVNKCHLCYDLLKVSGE